MSNFEDIKDWQPPKHFDLIMLFGSVMKYLATFFVFTSIIGFYYLWITKQIPSQYALPMSLGINWMAFDYIFDGLIKGDYYGGKAQGFKDGLHCGADIAKQAIIEVCLEEVKKDVKK